MLLLLFKFEMDTTITLPLPSPQFNSKKLYFSSDTSLLYTSIYIIIFFYTTDNDDIRELCITLRARNFTRTSNKL